MKRPLFKADVLEHWRKVFVTLRSLRSNLFLTFSVSWDINCVNPIECSKRSKPYLICMYEGIYLNIYYTKHVTWTFSNLNILVYWIQAWERERERACKGKPSTVGTQLPPYSSPRLYSALMERGETKGDGCVSVSVCLYTVLFMYVHLFTCAIVSFSSCPVSLLPSLLPPQTDEHGSDVLWQWDRVEDCLPVAVSIPLSRGYFCFACSLTHTPTLSAWRSCSDLALHAGHTHH